MSPLVRDGDVVTVRPVDPGVIRVGDLVLAPTGPGGACPPRHPENDRSGGVRFTMRGDQAPGPTA